MISFDDHFIKNHFVKITYFFVFYQWLSNPKGAPEVLGDGRTD
jgi:hypothetical protein